MSERKRPTINLANPYRPRLIKLANKILPVKKFDFDELTESVAKSVGTSDYGKKDFLEHGKFLLSCVYKTANLNPVGHLLTKQYFTEILTNKLHLEKRIKTEKLAEMKSPVFILGLPRTGSTFLFNLMASTNHFRFLRNWETNFCAKKESELFRRIQAQILLWSQDYVSPGLKVIHEQRLEGPEECSKLLMNTFVCQIFPGLFHVPEYNEFLADANYNGAYQIYKQQLQLLNTFNKRWLLKGPAHLQAVDQIIHHFPDAKIIYLSREFNEVLGSACSLSASFRLMITDDLDGAKIGEQVKKLLVRDLKKAEAIIASNSKNCLHLNYLKLIKDPVESLKQIFEFLDLKLEDNHLAQVFEESKRSPKDKYGKHIYYLEDYKLA